MRRALSGIPEASPPPPQAATTSGRTPAANARQMPARAFTPGPNAFAARAAEADAHRLRSNAFYQQAIAAEDARRQAVQDKKMADSLDLTPPTAVHPALRENFRVGDSSPTSNLKANQMVVAKAKSSQTPPLKLIPDEGFQGKPTDREFIESFHEELDPNETEHSVVKYTPKLGSSEFSKSVGPATPHKKKGGLFNRVVSEDQPGSPKKTLREKFGLTATRTSQASEPTSAYTVTRGDSGGELLPPKVTAVLITPSKKKTALGRSPSRRFGNFARKASDAIFSSEMTKARRLSLGNDQPAISTSTRRPNFSASVSHKTPAREQRPKVARYASQPQRPSRSGRYQDMPVDPADIVDVIGAQSLQYGDGQNPPTPPAKDTPPQEKKLKAQKEEADRILKAHKERCENKAEVINKTLHTKQVIAATPKREMQQRPESKLTSPLRHKKFEDDTPTRDTVKLMGADGRTSPTKYGGYARTHLPNIVNAPSVHSMHGSYVADLHEEPSLQDVNSGLDGLHDIPENFYKGDPKVDHSPSLYEEDWSTHGNVSHKASVDTLHTTGMFKLSPSIPDVLEKVRQLSYPALPASATQARQLPPKIRTPSKGSPFFKARSSSRSSSIGTIPCLYPGLASDPSRMNLLEGLDTRRGSAPPNMGTEGHYDSLMDLSDQSDDEDDLPQASPNGYSHPSAEPSPLFVNPPEFSPVVKSTPPRKTLTPSRSRGRIEDSKKNGSPIARDAASFPVESQTHTLHLPSPVLKGGTPAISLTPPAGSSAVFHSLRRSRQNIDYASLLAMARQAEEKPVRSPLGTIMLYAALLTERQAIEKDEESKEALLAEIVGLKQKIEELEKGQK
jgi:hypothetical protein